MCGATDHRQGSQESDAVLFRHPLLIGIDHREVKEIAVIVHDAFGLRRRAGSVEKGAESVRRNGHGKFCREAVW